MSKAPRCLRALLAGGAEKGRQAVLGKLLHGGQWKAREGA